MMKIVFIHGKYFNSWEAQGIGWIASYLRKYRPELQMGFFQGCFDDEAEIIAAGAKADIAAFSCTSPSMLWASRVAAAIKAENPRVRTVVGGYHASALPQDALDRYGFDQAVVGEGEAAMLAIANGLRDKVVFGRPMRFAELPWPDRELIRNERNIEVAANDTGRRITSFQSQRGCPFSCKFCGDGGNVLTGGRQAPVRRRDVENLLNEIELVARKYDIDFFKFNDPTWNSAPAYIKEFCKLKIARKNTLPFFANIHPNATDVAMFRLMYDAGCREIGIGIESGSDRLLAACDKGTSRETVRHAVFCARQVPMHIRGYFILGIPTETPADLAATEAFADELDLDEYGFTILCPYPGSFYYNQNADGFKNIDWSVTDEYSNDFWCTDELSNERLKKAQARLTEKFAGKITQHQRDRKTGRLKNGNPVIRYSGIPVFRSLR